MGRCFIRPTMKIKTLLPAKVPLVVPYVPIIFNATWDDPGANDKFTIVWTITRIDSLIQSTTIETVTQDVNKAHKAMLLRAFTTPALYSVSVEVTDASGGKGGNTTNPFAVVQV